MNNKAILVIVILLVAGAVAVYVALNMPVDSAPQTQTQNQQNNTNNTSQPARINIDELAAQFPTESSTQAQKESFNLKVRGMSVQATTLDITNCLPSPQIMRVQQKKPFVVKNSDKVERQITHTEFNITAAAQSEKQYTPNFPGEGAFGYRCGGKLVGIIYVTP